MNWQAFTKELETKNLYLTKSQQQIARYLVENPGQVAFLSITELAKETGVSEATIVRYAKELGFSGFQELKERIQELIKTSAAGPEKAGPNSVLHQFVTQQIQYLQQLLQTVHNGDLCSISAWIVEADTIYLFGDSSGHTPCSAFDFRLTRFGFHSQWIQDEGRRVFNRLLRLGPQDVLIIFAFSRQNSTCSMLLDFARSRGAHSALITDVPYTPMAELAEKVIVVERGMGQYYRTMAVPVVLADTLAYMAAEIKGDEALRAQEELEMIREKYGIR